MSSNVLTGQILSVENLFMSKSLAKIKRLRSKPMFDVCCLRVGNDRKRCLLDESLFLFFFFLFLFFFFFRLRAKLAREVPQN